MSTEVVSYEDQLAKMADAAVAAERSAATNVFLSAKGGILTYRSNPLVGNSINVVVLASPVERLFYADGYDPTKPAGPACFSLALQAVGMAPSALATGPQHATCQGCPQDQWGSAAKGTRKGKACRETRRLLLLTEDSIESVEKVQGAEIAAFRPPVTSLASYATYVQRIATVNRRPLAGVVTKLSIVPDPKNQFRMQLDFVRLIDDLEIVAALIKRGEEEAARAIATAGIEESEAGADVKPSSKF